MCGQAAEKSSKRQRFETFERFELLLRKKAIEGKFSWLPDGLKGSP